MMNHQVSTGSSAAVQQSQPGKKPKKHHDSKQFECLQMECQNNNNHDAHHQPNSSSSSRPPTPPGAPPVVHTFAPLPPNPDPQNVPTGLEYLTVVDRLAIQQKVELLEAFTGWETNNKYVVKNSVGQSVYLAVEDNDCCTRQCCGSARPFDIDFFDNYHREIMNIHRPLRCNCCCFPCQELEVCSTTSDRLLGTVQQDWSWCRPQFSLLNGAGEHVLKISGPFLKFSCGRDIIFDVLTVDQETKVGEIAKRWSGFTQEYYTDADLFTVTFPLDLDVQVKATLLATTFLIDFMYFER